jgi:hypothetical protein
LSLVASRAQRILLALIPLVIVGGVFVDQYWKPWGQPVVSVIAWLAFASLLWFESASMRPALLLCLIIATTGEVFLSLIWGLYDYRLNNIPLFVPPGHVLLFWFGLRTVAALPGRWLDAVPWVAGGTVLSLAVMQHDFINLPLFAMFVLCWKFGPTPRFYAWMFVLALSMELLATRVGNWTWPNLVPVLGWPAMNPPLAAGAFYCVLDLLVLSASRPVLRFWQGSYVFRNRLLGGLFRRPL